MKKKNISMPTSPYVGSGFSVKAPNSFRNNDVKATSVKGNDLRVKGTKKKKI